MERRLLGATLALLPMLIVACGTEQVAAPAAPRAAATSAPTATPFPLPAAPSAGGMDTSPDTGASEQPAPPVVSPSVSPGPRMPGPRRVVEEGSGEFYIAAGEEGPTGKGERVRYHIEVEEGIGADSAAFAAAAHASLTDQRSWGGAGGRSFHRVSSGPVDFRLVLASPETTDRQCFPFRTRGEVSCYVTGLVVINARRWVEGSPYYPDDLPGYRHYVVNHEVGHALDNRHVKCPGAAELAPIMQQQTLGVEPCRPNPWPFPDADPGQG